MASTVSRHRTALALCALPVVLAATIAMQHMETDRPTTQQISGDVAAATAESPQTSHRDDSVASPASSAPTPTAQMREPATEAERLQQVERNIRLLDTQFAAESIDGSWSLEQARAIGKFFEPAALATAGVAAPSDLRVDCRSRSCRMTGVFADELEAELASQQLAMRLAATLPYGAVMPRRSPSGGIEVNAWYSTTPLMR